MKAVFALVDHGRDTAGLPAHRRLPGHHTGHRRTQVRRRLPRCRRATGGALPRRRDGGTRRDGRVSRARGAAPPHGCSAGTAGRLRLRPGHARAGRCRRHRRIGGRPIRREAADIPDAFLRSFIGTTAGGPHRPDPARRYRGRPLHLGRGNCSTVRRRAGGADPARVRPTAGRRCSTEARPKQVRRLQYETFLEHFGNMSKTPEIFRPAHRQPVVHRISARW